MVSNYDGKQMALNVMSVVVVFFAASEARAAGRGGIVVVYEITGLARSTIGRGLNDLDIPPSGQVRRPGGGPRPLTERNPKLLDDLRHLVDL